MQSDRSIGTQHNKAPRERFKSRAVCFPVAPAAPQCLALTGPRSADPSRTSLNKLSAMADVALVLMFMALQTYIGIQIRRIQHVRV